MICAAAEGEFSYTGARSKLAEVLEKILKAELIRLGWRLVKTHDLNLLALALDEYGSESASAAEPICKALAEVYFTDRYPGFDLDEEDWPALRTQIEQFAALLADMWTRVAATKPNEPPS